MVVDAACHWATRIRMHISLTVTPIDPNHLSGTQTKYVHQTFNKKQICLKYSLNCKISLCVPERSLYKKSYSTMQLF